MKEYKLKTNIKFIEDMLDAGYNIRDYSGRFMFGKHCPGVVVSPYDIDCVMRSTKIKLRQDSMGLDVILYTGIGE